MGTPTLKVKIFSAINQGVEKFLEDFDENYDNSATNKFTIEQNGVIITIDCTGFKNTNGGKFDHP